MKNRLHNNIIYLSIIFTTICGSIYAQNKGLNTIVIDKNHTLQQYLKYTGDGSIIISGHRGGRETGFPENSIAGFENVLRKMPAIFEIDPRLTYDGVIVLMHDAKIDRTTNGKGKVADYTYKELLKYNLKDKDDKITPHKIPTLEEAIVWSKGKTILNLDHKDVPASMAIDLIKKHNARNIMFTVHNGKQAQYIYNALGSQTMFSAFIKNKSDFEEYQATGIPWENFIAYIGPAVTPENIELCTLLRSKGVRCMTSLSPTHDTITNAQERDAKYLQEIKTSPDIIESDLPVEVNKVLLTTKK